MAVLYGSRYGVGGARVWTPDNLFKFTSALTADCENAAHFQAHLPACVFLRHCHINWVDNGCVWPTAS
jgi:hypothetical protein